MRPQYGTSIHYPPCADRNCTGCLEEISMACVVDLTIPKVIDGEMVGVALEGLALGVTDDQRQDLKKRMADSLEWWR